MKPKTEFDKFRDMVKVIINSPKPKPAKKKKRAKVSKKNEGLVVATILLPI